MQKNQSNYILTFFLIILDSHRGRGTEGASGFREYIAPGLSHDLREYEMITNNLYAVMLRPLQKPDAPGTEQRGLMDENTQVAASRNSKNSRRSGLVRAIANC
ncbi:MULTISPECIES: hypothetical protein [unclassified Microcoleus]|uniref:hypothetical protein n=1 Tax=unclassified Microcoleus TaxID=2642155 RepID=UPI002FCE9612